MKPFNTTFAQTPVAGEVGGQQLDLLIAGDDQHAKKQLPSRPPMADYAVSTPGRYAARSSSSTSASPSTIKTHS